MIFQDLHQDHEKPLFETGMHGYFSVCKPRYVITQL